MLMRPVRRSFGARLTKNFRVRICGFLIALAALIPAAPGMFSHNAQAIEANSRSRSKIDLVSATASPAVIAPGEIVNFNASLKANAAIKDAYVVLVVMRQNSAHILLKKILSNVDLAPGETKAISWSINAPASTPVGTYKISVAAFDKNGRVIALYANAATASVAVPRPSYIGVNIADGAVPGVYGEDWIYPQASDLDYFNSKGLSLIRLPFLWERLQPALNGELDPVELQRLRDVTALAAQRKMRMILNVYSTGKYNGQQIGQGGVSSESYTDFLVRIADAFSGDDGVYAYSILDEPAGFNGDWPAIAQAAVDAIRTKDSAKLIMVPGECGSRTKDFGRCNSDLKIVDAANNFAYAAKVFFSNDDTYNYLQSYDVQNAYPAIPVERMSPFVDFLKARSARGYIAEFTIPNDDPRWQPLLTNALQYMKTNCMLGTFFTAGVTTANQRISIQPINGADKPQIQLLQPFTTATSCRTF